MRYRFDRLIVCSLTLMDDPIVCLVGRKSMVESMNRPFAAAERKAA